MGGTQTSKLTSNHHTAANGDGGDESVEVLSREPRLSVYHNFLSKEEYEYLIELAKPSLKRSKVASRVTLEGVESSNRTSSEASLKRVQNKIIQDIEERIAKWTLVPVDHGEGLRVIHYQVGQKFEPHWDYFRDEINTRNGGNRMATVLIYLSDVEEGGETVFTNAKKIHDPLKRGISVKCFAIIVGASPVIKGNKWCCTNLICVNKFN